MNNLKKETEPEPEKKTGGQVQLDFNHIPNYERKFGLDTRIHFPTWQNSTRPHFVTIVRVTVPQERGPARLLENLYGSSLPNMQNRKEVFDTLSFYMYRKQINRIVSLQDCAQQGSLISKKGKYPCNEDDTKPGNNTFEDESWEVLKNLHKNNRTDRNIVFNNIHFPDFTAGTLNNWGKIGDLNVSSPQGRTLIHCHAGFGRTGTVLLFFILKHLILDSRRYTQLFEYPFFGEGNSNSMYYYLRNLLQQNVIIDDDETMNSRAYNARIKQFKTDDYIEYIYTEVFDIRDPTHRALLIQRINYLTIAVGCAVRLWGAYNATPKTIYLYDIRGAAVNDSDKYDLFKPFAVTHSGQDLITYALSCQKNLKRAGLVYN